MRPIVPDGGVKRSGITGDIAHLPDLTPRPSDRREEKQMTTRNVVTWVHDASLL